MIQHTKICKMDGKDNPVHLCDLDGLIPNVFVGMQMQVKGTKYKRLGKNENKCLNTCTIKINVVSLHQK